MENVILLVVMTQQDTKVPTTRIERPIVGEDTIEGVIARRHVSAFPKQQAGFLEGQLHGKGWKRA